MRKFIIYIIFALIAINLNAQSIIESNNQFGFEFYQEIKSNNNFVFSPASISSAFAMTYNGAQGNTFNEMAQVFHFNKNLSEFNTDYKNLFTLNENQKDFQFYNANSLWIQEGMEIKQNFLDVNKTYYGASLNLLDFKNDSEKSRITINNWVSEKTKNKINDLLNPSTIDNATRLVLVNALYFKGAWKKQFKKEQNTKDKFQVAKRDFIEADFMNTSVNTWYYQDNYAEIIDIPYSDDDYSLMIIVPKSYRKIKKLEKKLDQEFYNNYINYKEKKQVKLSIPKFNIKSDYDLGETLVKMGLKDAFTGNADFSGITEQEKLYISQAIHKATIEINEEGTEAAAATAVVMRKMSVMLDNVELKVDRPFIYILRNNQTNCIYFIGKVVNPNK